jgi:NTP pyrophosphatase (non-canonical NTP hydrolase)
MDVKALQARLDAFARERGWDVLQNPRNLAIALAGEAGMLLDLFRWLTDAQSHRIESEYKREAAEEAIADLLLHTLRLADKLGIDVERAVAKKLAENDANYPPEPAPAVAPAAGAGQPKPVAQETTPKPAEAPGPVANGAAPEPAAAPKPAPTPVKSAPPPPPPPAEAKVPSPPPRPEKPLPTWLDGILPARSGAARRKQSPPAKAGTEPSPPPEPPKVAPPPKGAKAPAPPPAPERVEPAPPPVVEPIEAAPPPPEPGSGPASEPLPERYADLDTDAAKVLAKALAKRVDGARSDDPLLRELHDEVETLRRTLYSPTPKRSWIGDSLKTIHAILEEATTHEVGQAIRADEYIAQIDRLLER